MASENKTDDLTITKIVTYALPAFPASLVLITVAIYLPNFYTDDLGVTAGMLGWVFLLGRFWDAVTDPAMGYLSDRTRSRWGRRRPFLLLAAIPMWLTFYLIWSPNPDWSPTVLFLYLMVCYLTLYTFWTVFNVPYQSLGMELTSDYHQRTVLFAVRQAAYVVGTIFGMMIPAYLVGRLGNRLDAYSTFSLYAGALIVVILVFAFLSLREREDIHHAESFPFLEGMKITFKNRAFVILVLTYLASVVGASFIAPLSLYIAKYVIKMEGIVQYIVLVYMLGSLLSIPVWAFIAKKTSKVRAWQIALTIGGVAYFGALTYSEGTWILWMIFAAIVGTTFGCTMAIGPAIIADVIDQDELETGKRREGAFVGVQSFVDKAAVGLAVFIGMQGLAYIGYVPNVEQTPQVVSGLLFLYGILPGVLQLVSVVIIQRFPITPEVHQDIRRQLGR
jgi:GPH family glycoside/pentoside/hexuronide:cation symporter